MSLPRRICPTSSAAARHRRRASLVAVAACCLMACGPEPHSAEDEAFDDGYISSLASTQLTELGWPGQSVLGQLWQPRHPALMPSAKIVRQEMPVKFEGLPASSLAYNWGMVSEPMSDRFLAAVRVETLDARGGRVANRIAMTTLDASLRPLAPLAFVDPPRLPGASHTAEDPRLLRHQGQLYVAYNKSYTRVWNGPRTMFLAKLLVAGPPTRRHFTLADEKTLTYNHHDDQPPLKLQKNWAPFSYGEQLCFLYRSSPTVTLCLSPQQLASDQSVLTPTLWGHSYNEVRWDWGEVRGGTPAFYLPELDRFATFFHSSKVTQELGSKVRRRHYFTGFLTFMPHPPFAIDQALDHPLISPLWMLDMDTARHHIFFAQGVALRDDQIIVSCGRNDVYAAAMVLDRAQLLKHLSAARISGQPRRPVPRGAAS